jgi:hypothetical protein
MANFPLPKGYQRLGPFPLDDTSIFTSLALLNTYASSGTAYIGQICVVVTDVVTPYCIGPGYTVTQLGGSNSSFSLDSLQLTGIPTAPTPAIGTNTTQLATTEFVYKVDNYTYDQQVASDTWVIVHNLGKYPTHVAIDSAGEQIIGNIKYDSPNQFTLTFSAQISGKVYIT